MEKRNRPDLENEMDELQRVVQDLSRDEDITVSVDELVNVFNDAKEVTLSDEIWSNLENTESNEIKKGDMDSVMNIAKTYKKTNPNKLVQAIKSGEYKRPLILKFGDRYHLVAGNTRLCTAAAMGVNPKVYIGTIDNINESEKLKGGLSDKKTLEDIAKKHDSKEYYHIDNMIQSLQKELNMGVKIEMEHTNDKDKAKEIAMDHLWETPSYYSKLKKIETKESTDAGSSGSFSTSVFGSHITKREIYKIHNAKLHEEIEVGESTDSSSSGSYDVPLFGKTPKGNRNPLKIDGVDSIYKGRAVKDKKFPKYGGSEGVYVKIKDKCKKYPYCNQGNTGSLEFIREDSEISEAITEISKKYGVPRKEVEKIVLNDITQIFI